MTRAKLTLTVEGTRGPVERLLDCLRDFGYTVGELPPESGRRVVVQVITPYGEIDARSSYLGPPIRR